MFLMKMAVMAALFALFCAGGAADIGSLVAQLDDPLMKENLTFKTDDTAETGGRMVLDLADATCRVQLAAGGVYPKPPKPPPTPACTFHPDMQLSDPGSKHTKPPVPAATQDTCCIACMEDATCFGAELYGGSCYKKTAPCPLVKQTPPKGVALVACVKNHSSDTAQSPTTVPARVPGDILAALERADQLGIGNQSMYFSTNLKSASVQAAQNASYWLNCSLSPNASFLARQKHTLIVDGLDYNATVYVNGHPIGTHAGPYQIGRLPVASTTLQASTELAFLFHMPPQGLIGGWLAPGNAVQGSMWNFLDFWKSMVGIGYDFGQPVWSIGIQEGAWLVATDSCLISDLAVLPILSADHSSAQLNASFSVLCDAPITAAVSWNAHQTVTNADGSSSVGPLVASAVVEVALKTGPNHVSVAGEPHLTVHQPALWWPRGFGNQSLHTLRVSVHPRSNSAAPLDSLSRSFGIRDLRQVRNPGPDSWTYIEEFYCGPGEHAGAPPDGGANCTFPEALVNLTPHQIEQNRNWTFAINGQPVFAHGANWVPCDMRISECTAEDYEYLIRSAASSNMNFIRVWGGGVSLTFHCPLLPLHCSP